MKTFNNLEEMKPYYNVDCNAYIFEMIDVEFNFNLNIAKSIYAKNITAKDINANNIEAWNIHANNIEAWNITAKDINAWNIDAMNIDACNIHARNIDASNITADNINAWNIDAMNINARNIEFYAVCFSYETFICDSIKGRRENSRYFCLDSDVVINKKED